MGGSDVCHGVLQVAGVTGDLRRALELCRKAAEITEREGGASVRLQQVDLAVRAMFGATHMQLLRTTCALDKLLLAGLLLETRATGAGCNPDAADGLHLQHGKVAWCRLRDAQVALKACIRDEHGVWCVESTDAGPWLHGLTSHISYDKMAVPS